MHISISTYNQTNIKTLKKNPIYHFILLLFLMNYQHHQHRLKYRHRISQLFYLTFYLINFLSLKTITFLFKTLDFLKMDRFFGGDDVSSDGGGDGFRQIGSEDELDDEGLYLVNYRWVFFEVFVMNLGVRCWLIIFNKFWWFNFEFNVIVG